MMTKTTGKAVDSHDVSGDCKKKVKLTPAWISLQANLTDSVKRTNSDQGRSRTADTRVDSACSRLAPPTSTDNFLAAVLKPTFMKSVSRRRSTPP